MIGLVYGRDILLSLNRGQRPSTLVKERLCRMGISRSPVVVGEAVAPAAAAGSRISSRSLSLTTDNRQNALPGNVVVAPESDTADGGGRHRRRRRVDRHEQRCRRRCSTSASEPRQRACLATNATDHATACVRLHERALYSAVGKVNDIILRTQRIQ